MKVIYNETGQFALVSVALQLSPLELSCTAENTNTVSTSIMDSQHRWETWKNEGTPAELSSQGLGLCTKVSLPLETHLTIRRQNRGGNAQAALQMMTKCLTGVTRTAEQYSRRGSSSLLLTFPRIRAPGITLAGIEKRRLSTLQVFIAVMLWPHDATASGPPH